MNKEPIPFNKPHMTGKELFFIAQAYFNGRLAGDGVFTKRCHRWLEEKTGCSKALLTHSCTAALEMAAILLDIKPGDEIIMPSNTFVSTANAFVMRGGVPVFVEIREDTLNLNENLIEAAITERTKVIVPVHYAGVSCEMDAIMGIAQQYNLAVVEDAAQAVLSFYKQRPLGSIGTLGTLSFHETKNLISGEGGAILINSLSLTQRAEIIREKGTDRSRFFRGEVDKYTWQDIGSSYLPGELIAAFLWAQLEEAEKITKTRAEHWNYYNERLKEFEDQGLLRRPIIPDDCQHNFHMYYIILSKEIDRSAVIQKLRESAISAVTHYVPLHTSPAGRHYCRAHGDFSITNMVSEKLLRLPLWTDITEEQQDRVVSVFKDF
jgi:dTDP-4-amino-4,6-dideoxygalactose transaminase